MERTESFSALSISALQVHLTTAALTLVVGDASDLCVTVSGKCPDSVRLDLQDGRLMVVQSLHPGRSINAVTIALPHDWKGAVSGRSIAGSISASGITGTDLHLCSLLGGVYAQSLTGITASLRSITGAIGVSQLSCEQCTVRTFSGQIILSGSSFLTGRCSALLSRIELDLAASFDALSILCPFGSATVYAPIPCADAALATLKGRMLTDSALISQDAPRIRMRSVLADLQFISSLDDQAIM